MAALALLAGMHRRGVMARRRGDRVWFRPAAALPSAVLEKLRQRKSDLLRLLPDEAAEPVGPWRLVIESCEATSEPIRLNGWTTITNPARCIEYTVLELKLALAHKNAGRETVFTALIDEYLATLAACGCSVRVEAIA